MATYIIEQFFQNQDAWFFAQQTLTNYTTGLAVIWALFCRFARGEQTLFPMTREFWLSGAVYGYAALSTIWAVNPESPEMFRKYFPELVAFGFMLPMLINRFSDLKVLFFFMIGIGLILVPVFVFGVEWAGRQVVLNKSAAIGSLISEGGNPLAIASYAGYCACISALIRFKRFNPLLETVRWAFCLLSVWLCLKTASRGQSFAIAVAILTFVPIAWRMNSPGRFVGVAILVSLMVSAGGIIFEAYAHQDETRWNIEGFWDAWSEGRVGNAIILLRYWAEAGPAYWIFGIGNSGSYVVPGLMFYAHVVPAEALGELGIIGFAMIVCVPILFFVSFRQVFVRVREMPVERGLIAALGACFLFEVVISFKQGALQGCENGFAFMMILGRLLYNMKAEEQRYVAADDGYYAQQAALEAEEFEAAGANDPEEAALAR